MRARLEAAGVQCVSVDLAQGSFDGRSRRCRLRLQLRGREEQQVGSRSRRERRSRRAADGALPRRPRVPALFVDGRLRSGRRFTATRDRSARRQPPRDDADVQHLARSRPKQWCARRVGSARCSDDDRAAQRAVRRRRWLARVPPRAHAGRARGSGASRTDRVASTRSTRTTSSPRCRACSRPRRCRRRSSIGAATRRRVSRAGANTWPSSSVSKPRFDVHDEHDRRHPDRQHETAARSSAPTTVGWKDGMRRMVEAQVAGSAPAGTSGPGS